MRSALRDVDYNLAQLTTTKRKRPNQALVSARSEEVVLELDGVLHYVLVGCQPPSVAHQPFTENYVKHDPELAPVEQVSNTGRRDPIRHLQDTVRGERPLRSDADESETSELHHILKPPRAEWQGVLGSLNRFTVDELRDKIRSTPELSSIPIGDLFRRKIPTGFQHEFILVKSAAGAGPSVWIRIDRAAKGYQSGRIRTRYPANDTVSTLEVRSCS